MGERETNTIRAMVDELYRLESRRVFATLVRLTGNFDLAEEVLHEAFAAAIEQWPCEGMPENPRAWLVSTGRFKAIDFVRRRTRFDSSVAKLTQELEKTPNGIENWDDTAFRDDHLRLIFTCCHPALPPDTQVALTLREVCGLTTEEIASAFLTTASTMAQRIVRGKAKIRDARIPYQLPALDEIPDRLDSVLSVIYLIFNEGYSASSGASVTRADLSAEAIRLGRVLLELLPDSEVMGLLALMLFHESRHASRSTPAGDIVLLEDQDRSLWDRDLIAEARQLVERALASRPIGPYTIQAAIASVHAEAQTPEQTDWPRIVALYDLLLRAAPSPVIELNGRSRWPCVTDRRQASLWWMPFSNAGNWAIITSPMLRARTCAGVRAKPPRPGPHTSGRSCSRIRNPNAGFWKGALGNSRKKNGPRMSIRGPFVRLFSRSSANWAVTTRRRL